MIYLYEQFKKLYEKEDLVQDAMSEPEPMSLPQQKPIKKNKQYLKKSSVTAQKDFFSELRDFVVYWFKYEDVFSNYTLEDVDVEDKSVTCWFFDDKYAYKVKYSYIVTKEDIEKVEVVMFNISIYDDNKLMKKTEMKISTKNINSKFLNKTIKELKKRILTVPKNKEDIEKFNNRQERRLGDNMY